MQKKIIKLSIILLIIFIIGVFFIGLNKNSIYDTKGLVGQKITNVQLDHFSKNKIITEKDLSENQFTLINFWASWCGPCRVEHPVLMKLSAENNLDILGVNFKDKKELARKFLKDLGNPYNSLLKDVEGKQSIIFGIYGIPESLIINNKNTIIKKFVGPLSLDDYKEIKEMIK